MNRFWRGPLAAMATALMVMGATGATGVSALATPLQVTFQATPDNCLQGTANGPFRLELLSHTNVVLDTVDSVTPDGSHRWEACFPVDFVSSGKKLKATADTLTGTVSFTIPTLTVDTDRITDVVKGKAPANHQVKVRIYDCSRVTEVCVHTVTRTVNVNGSGHYDTDVSNSYNTHGYDEARVTYTNSAGHSFKVRQIFPWMAVIPPDDFVFGESRAGQKVTFRLLSAPGGTLLSQRSRTPSFADYSFTFGAATSTGRQVTADFATDAKLTIPSTHLSTEIVGSDTILHLRCLPNRLMMVDFNPGPNLLRHADAHGKVDVNVTQDAPGVDLATDGVGVTCESAAGDVINRRWIAPIN